MRDESPSRSLPSIQPTIHTLSPFVGTYLAPMVYGVMALKSFVHPKDRVGEPLFFSVSAQANCWLSARALGRTVVSALQAPLDPWIWVVHGRLGEPMFF
jgi:hypothetical protein